MLKFDSKMLLLSVCIILLIAIPSCFAHENDTLVSIDEENTLEFETDNFYLNREDEMWNLFDFVPEAIENAHKASFKKVMHKLLGKNKDDSDRIILKEEDFR